MPKKKRGKDTGSEFVFDYRYTPKPYFTAPLGTPDGKTTSESNLFARRPNLKDRYGSDSDNSAILRGKVPINGLQVNGQRNASYSSLTQDFPSLKTSKRGTEECVTIPGGTVSENEKLTMKKMFVEMFKGRVETSVIEMVLQEENWNGELILLCHLC